jgi:hypothetical protein
MDKTRLLTILRNDNVLNILKAESDTICNTLYDLLSTLPFKLHSEVIDIVEKNDISELSSALADYAAKLDSDAITKKYAIDSITRAQAAECHMIAVSCRGIISLFNGKFNTQEINEYMLTYVSDLKKFDEDIANTIESAYSKKQIDYLLSFCKYQLSNNELIAELTLTGTTRYNAHSYDKLMNDTHKYVESLRSTERDDFYSRLL